jgi:hypothetical protein
MARLRYLGGGFIPKVPARDLTPDEAKQHGIERLVASGLYRDLYPKQEEVTVTYEDDVELLEHELDKLDDTFNKSEE